MRIVLTKMYRFLVNICRMKQKSVFFIMVQFIYQFRNRALQRAVVNLMPPFD